MARLRFRDSLVALAGAASAASVASGAPPAVSPYDVTSYPVVVSDPGMKDVTVTPGIWGEGLSFEIARPAGEAGSGKRPAVVFVNGVGGKRNEWGIYRSWARLVAARGLAGITFESKSSGSSAGVSVFLSHLAKNADAPALRKELPVFWVLAGRDSPHLVEGQKALFARAVKEQLPWTMVVAPDLPHAFDAVEETPRSRAVVRETLAFLEAALAPAAPAAGESLPKRATAFLFANEPENAVAPLREILAKTPDDGEARATLGLALSRSGKPGEAVAELEKALALGADSPSLQQNLGEAYLRSGNPAEAAVHYRKAVASGRRFPPVLYNLARAAALSGERDESFAWLAALTEIDWAGRAQVEAEADLASLRSDPRWLGTLARFPAPAR